ncbi:hypothetical protein DWV76_00715 [Segatella copri]|uniref:Uncharacterized protein n=1 Tax=Segatella copri TaxID=165179 RepID=A0AA93BF72_9BACT|nr:hypothetical protein [Segatella copri]RGW45074.1 hypothetical protein DWV76_00715 [Segatella copri]
MKIRLAKKIMTQARTDIPRTNLYWRTRIEIHDWGHGFVLDHRISKAKKMTTRWNARKLINVLVKLNKKHQFKLRDIQRNAERLKQYNV